MGGMLNFDTIYYSMLSVFVIITRRGWSSVLHMLWDTYGFVMPTIFALILMMFGSYLLTQLITAAIAITYQKVYPDILFPTVASHGCTSHSPLA